MNPVYELSNILSHLDGDLSRRLEEEGFDTDKFDSAVAALREALGEFKEQEATEEEEEEFEDEDA